MIVTAPASTANLGPGFDTLALALDLEFSIALNEQPRGGAWEPATEDHTAIEGYKAAGGITKLHKIWVQSRIPYARGLGYSGATRVAGAYAALRQNGQSEHDARDHAFRIAGDLEEADDNPAASTYGGLCVTTSGHVMRFDCEPHLQGLKLLFFVPELTAFSGKSRSNLLPETYTRDELVQSVGNVAMLTSMLSSNTFNDQVLNIVTKDIIHQPVRLDHLGPSKKAFEGFAEYGAVAQWLSGSGSTVAALVEEEKIDDIKARMEQLELECPFSIMQLGVSQEGVREVLING